MYSLFLDSDSLQGCNISSRTAKAQVWVFLMNGIIVQLMNLSLFSNYFKVKEL